jgi:hypothetical protein
VNVILAVSQNASAQRAELIAERDQLLHRVAAIGNDLAILDAYELLANEQTNGAGSAAPKETPPRPAERSPER